MFSIDVRAVLMFQMLVALIVKVIFCMYEITFIGISYYYIFPVMILGFILLDILFLYFVIKYGRIGKWDVTLEGRNKDGV